MRDLILDFHNTIAGFPTGVVMIAKGLCLTSSSVSAVPVGASADFGERSSQFKANLIRLFRLASLIAAGQNRIMLGIVADSGSKCKPQGCSCSEMKFFWNRERRSPRLRQTLLP